MTILSASAIGATVGRGEVPSGGQKAATGRTVRVANWNPANNVGNPGLRNQADVLFAPVIFNELDALDQGGRLNTSFLSYFTTAKATLIDGPIVGKMQDVVAAAGQAMTFQLDGILPLDEWTIEIPVISVGADITAQTSGSLPILHLKTVSGDELRVTRSSTNVLTARVYVSGTPGALAQMATLTTGDIPADTLKVISVTYKAAQSKPLRIYLGNNAKSSATGTGSSETSPSTEGLPVRPWSNLVTGGLGIGTDFSSGYASWMKIGIPVIRRAQMTPAAGANVKLPTIAVDPNTTAGAFPDIAGVLHQYQGWTGTGHDSSSAIRTSLAAQWTAAGLKRARIEHITDKAIITGTAGSWSADWTPLWEQMDELYSGGVRTFDLTLGYTPSILGASQATVPSSTPAFAAMCLAFVTAAVARYPLAGFTWSLWNEPDAVGFWAGTTQQLVDIWAAVHDVLASAFPAISVGASECASWAVSAVTKAIIDRAATDGRRLDHVRFHDYSSDLNGMRKSVADVLAYVAGKTNAGSFVKANVTAAITEWNWALQDYGQYESATSAISAYYPPPSRTEKIAGFSYAYLVEALTAGVSFTSFTRTGLTTAGSASGAEAHIGAFSIDDPPHPLPAFAAFQAWLKMSGGTRITATANGWPELRSVAAKHADGRIVVTYGTWKPSTTTRRPVNFEWSNLPATFTWKHWQIDRTNYHDGRLVLVASGTQLDLPIAASIGSVGVGAIEITPS